MAEEYQKLEFEVVWFNCECVAAIDGLVGDRQDGMIQGNRLDTDRGIVKVAERKFPGQKLFNGLIWLIYNKR